MSMRFRKLVLFSLVLSIIIMSMTQLTVAAEVNQKDTKLYPVSNTGKFVYVNIKGEIVLTPKNCSNAYDFVGGVAQIIDSNGETKHFIDVDSKNAKAPKTYPNYKFMTLSKGKPVLDIYNRVKTYTKPDPDIKGITWDYSEYDLGDGFVVIDSVANGGHMIQLQKNGKTFVTDDSYMSLKEIFQIVKYDDEKMIRIHYSDYNDDCKFKTTYVDYSGKRLFTQLKDSKQISVMVNNKKASDPAVLLNKVVMVPLEETLVNLGYKIKADTKAQTLTATKGTTTITINFAIAKVNTVTVNKKVVKLSTYIDIINYLSYISAQDLAKIVSGSYKWDAKSNTVYIKLK